MTGLVRFAVRSSEEQFPTDTTAAHREVKRIICPEVLEVHTYFRTSDPKLHVLAGLQYLALFDLMFLFYGSFYNILDMWLE